MIDLANAAFYLSYMLTVPAWFLILVRPHSKLTERLISSGAVTVLLSIQYLVLILFSYQGIGGFQTLEALARLFSSPGLLSAAWSHFLAFDLLVGGWVLRDSRQIGLKHSVVAPSLLMIYLLGPVGLLSYFVIKRVLRPAESLVSFPPSD